MSDDLIGISVDDLKAMRSSAQEALQRLVLGDNAQALGQDGKNATFTPAEIPQLRMWISQLTAAIGDRPARTRRGPMRPFF